MKTKIAVLVGILAAFTVMAATPYILLSTFTQRRITVPIVAGAAVWTNSYQMLAVSQIEIVGAQLPGSTNLMTNAVIQLVTSALTNPQPSFAISTNILPAMTISAISGTSTGYGISTNAPNAFYGDLISLAAAGVSNGFVLITGYSP